MPLDDTSTVQAGSRLAAPRGTQEPRAVSVSVVICAYTTQRWQQMCAAVDSVLAQDQPVEEVLLVIDHNDGLYERAVSRYSCDPNLKVLRNNETRGLSGARNTGLQAAKAQVVAFLDDDAYAETDWSRAMIAHYGDPDVQGVGGSAVPRWPVARPGWLPEEFDWVVGCSYTGQPTAVAPVRNFLGCNMSLRRDVITLLGGFDSSVGRVGTRPTGCEETELCIRIRQRNSSARLILDPGMRVHHTVAAERTTFSYFARRCYHEGLSKAIVSGLVGADDGLSSERSYVIGVLPKAVGRGVAGLKGRGLVQAAVVITGLALTAFGYAEGRVRAALEGAAQ